MAFVVITSSLKKCEESLTELQESFLGSHHKLSGDGTYLIFLVCSSLVNDIYWHLRSIAYNFSADNKETV